MFWGLALVVTLRGLSSIENPTEHIDPIGQGTYYDKYFKFSFIDSIFNQSEKKPDKTINDIVKHLPQNKDALEKELAFEQLKLSYIRGIKIVRQKYAYLFLLLWIVSGGLIWAISL